MNEPPVDPLAIEALFPGGWLPHYDWETILDPGPFRIADKSFQQEIEVSY